MNWSMKEVVRVLLVIAILAGGTLFVASDVGAQETGGTLAKQIQGTWILVSCTNVQPDGTKSEPFGSNPRGLQIFTPDGRFVSILMRASIPKFAIDNRVKGTVEENNAVVEGSFMAFGTYKVTSDKEPIVIIHVEGSMFPNWDGQDLKQIITFKGDEMKMTVPPAAIGGTNYNVYKRAK
jgi:Lipocalin-like domain